MNPGRNREDGTVTAAVMRVSIVGLLLCFLHFRDSLWLLDR